MYAADTLGVATAAFVCTANGTCSGTTQAAQRAFIALQTQINRVGVSHGVTKLTVDGKLGPATLRSMVNLATALAARLGSNLDPAIEEIVIEVEGRPTTTRDLALNAERITAALVRDGASEPQWSLVTTMRDIAAGLVRASAAGSQSTPTPVTAPASPLPINPYPTTVSVGPSNTPPATGWIPPPAPPVVQQPPHIVDTSAVPGARPAPPWWVIAAGAVGATVVVGGLAALIARR